MNLPQTLIKENSTQQISISWIEFFLVKKEQAILEIVNLILSFTLKIDEKDVDNFLQSKQAELVNITQLIIKFSERQTLKKDILKNQEFSSSLKRLFDTDNTNVEDVKLNLLIKFFESVILKCYISEYYFIIDLIIILFISLTKIIKKTATLIIFKMMSVLVNFQLELSLENSIEHVHGVEVLKPIYEKQFDQVDVLIKKRNKVNCKHQEIENFMNTIVMWVLVPGLQDMDSEIRYECINVLFEIMVKNHNYFG
jgi:hypothetical protein